MQDILNATSCKSINEKILLIWNINNKINSIYIIYIEKYFQWLNQMFYTRT